MRVQQWLLWSVIAVLALGMFSVTGGVLALRWWPKYVVPHVPPDLLVTAYRLADGRGPGRELCLRRFREPELVDTICAALQGSDIQQGRMLALLHMIYSENNGVGDQQIIAALAVPGESPEPGRRCLARSLVSKRAMLHHLLALCGGASTASDEVSLLSVRCMALLACLSHGYDHRVPSILKKSVGDLLSLILACEGEAGAFASNPRDQALVTMALAELFAHNNDPALREPLQRARAHLLLGSPTTWTADRTLAAMTLMAEKSCRAAGLSAEALDDLHSWWLSIRDATDWLEAGVLRDPPSWERAAWDGLFSACLGDQDRLSRIHLELPPDELQAPSLVSLWLTIAAYQRSSEDFKGIAQIVASRGYNHACMLWHDTSATPSTQALFAGALTLNQDAFHVQYARVIPLPIP